MTTGMANLQVKLEEKGTNQERAMQARDELVFDPDMVKKNVEKISVMCERCGYIFSVPYNAIVYICPKCQQAHRVEPVNDIQDGNEKSALRGEMLQEIGEKRAKEAEALGYVERPKKPVLFDDAMNQDSLDMNSVEYKEYLDDIEEQQKKKEGDEFHHELADHNAEIGVQLALLAEQDENPITEYRERRANRMALKDDIHDEVVAELAKEASETPTLKDDKAVEKITRDNAAFRDPNVMPDEYHKALEDSIDMNYC